MIYILASIVITIASVLVYALTGYSLILVLPMSFAFAIVLYVYYNFANELFSGTKQITIFKNSHRGEHLVKFFFGNKLSYKYKFTPSCIYDLESDDNGDINKLFGFTHLYVHWDSVRFGWNCNLETEKINIYAYYYIKGTRYSRFLKEINIGEYYTFKIKIYEGYAYYLINHEFIYSHKFMSKVTGYENGVYFGGNRKAPNSMIILKSKT